MTQSWERVVDPMIYDRYREPQRHYHTLQHIREMMGIYVPRFSNMKELSDDQHTSLFFAIWYHDAVYEPTMGDNEFRSSLLVRREMDGRGFSQQVINDAVRLVLSTKEHNPESMDERVLSDLDLAILGADHERYKEYVGQVRKEFDFATDEQWAQGRSAVVEGFLNRRIYYHLIEREPLAKNNLGWELIQLQGHP